MRDYPQAELFRQAAKAIISVDSSAITNSHLQGLQIGEAIRELRIKAVRAVIKSVN
jgi:tRNA nucleotidyltransferase (CCA-adding enzyme)